MAYEPKQQRRSLNTGTPPPSSEADADLVATARSGALYTRHQAFSVLVLRYERLIRSLLRSLGATPAEAEDITQEAYLSAWRRLTTLQQPERFLPWLKQIAYRQFLRSIRRDKRDEPGAALEVASEDNPTLDRELATLLGHCSRDEQELLILYHAFGFSIGEIATARAVASGTIKSRLHRARHKIRAALGEDERGEQHNG